MKKINIILDFVRDSPLNSVIIQKPSESDDMVITSSTADHPVVAVKSGDLDSDLLMNKILRSGMAQC